MPPVAQLPGPGSVFCLRLFSLHLPALLCCEGPGWNLLEKDTEQGRALLNPLSASLMWFKEEEISQQSSARLAKLLFWECLNLEQSSVKGLVEETGMDCTYRLELGNWQNSDFRSRKRIKLSPLNTHNTRTGR